jgi:hypothetical protein
VSLAALERLCEDVPDLLADPQLPLRRALGPLAVVLISRTAPGTAGATAAIAQSARTTSCTSYASMTSPWRISL